MAIREPFDLYKWGNKFFSVILDSEKSSLHGVENLHKIREYLAKNENVFLFSNHQVIMEGSRVVYIVRVLCLYSNGERLAS